MNEPIDLNSRRETRTPEPDGEPDIRMPMDSDRIIFRDQAALDEYVAGALATVTDQRDKALVLAQQWIATAQQNRGGNIIGRKTSSEWCAEQLRAALGASEGGDEG